MKLLSIGWTESTTTGVAGPGLFVLKDFDVWTQAAPPSYMVGFNVELFLVDGGFWLATAVATIPRGLCHLRIWWNLVESGLELGAVAARGNIFPRGQSIAPRWVNRDDVPWLSVFEVMQS